MGEKLCQNCQRMTKKNGRGYCNNKKDFTARKNLCDFFVAKVKK